MRPLHPYQRVRPIAPWNCIGDLDAITIDAHQLLIQLNVDESEITKRRQAWSPPKSKYTRGLLAKYARLVSSASKGAVTDLNLG